MPADCQGTATLGTNYCVKQPKYQDIGEDPDGVLGMCSGDCDTDSDCDSGLQCLQRDGFYSREILMSEVIYCDECDYHIETYYSNYDSKCELKFDLFGIEKCLFEAWKIVRVENGPNSCSGKVSVGMKIHHNLA